jgi:hypothetical protein
MSRRNDTTDSEAGVVPTETAAPVPPSAPARPPRRSFKSIFWSSVLGALLLIGLYTAFMLWWSYSEGERAGTLQKFSKRGWLCKTYEGELAMYIVGGMSPQIYNFSVRDKVVAEKLQKAVGQHMSLHYTEHRGIPTTCFGETSYFVDSFEILPDPNAPYGTLPVPPAAPTPSPAVPGAGAATPSAAPIPAAPPAKP